MVAKRVSDVSAALQIYLENFEISNPEIIRIFGPTSAATVAKMKKEVKNEMAKRNILQYTTHGINTKVAYEIWGIDIEDLKKRRKELLRLGFVR